jgi:hypothetical protein
MVRKRDGFHAAGVEIPDILWQLLCEDAQARGESITRRLTLVVAAHYRIPASKLPRPKKVGRPARGESDASTP